MTQAGEKLISAARGDGKLTRLVAEISTAERRRAASICVAEARAEGRAALKAWRSYRRTDIVGSREADIEWKRATASRDALMQAARKIMGK